jgi:hypothetical protein
MKKIILLLVVLTGVIFSADAQFKKEGTPDMRYKANKQVYGNR